MTLYISYNYLIIGSSPIPGRLDSSQSYSKTVWWAVVEPTDEEEIQWAGSASSAPSGLQIDPVLARSWTHFDDIKLCAGLDILRQAALFLRIRAESWLTGSSSGHYRESNQGQKSHSILEAINSGGISVHDNIKMLKTLSGLMSFDLHAIAETFITCSKIARSSSGSGALENQIRSDWLQSSSPFVSSGGVLNSLTVEDTKMVMNWNKNDCKKCVNFVSENLICVIHAFVVTGDADDLKKWRVALQQLDTELAILSSGGGVNRSIGKRVGSGAGNDIALCITEAENMSAHSFQRVVSRWIRGIVESPQ